METISIPKLEHKIVRLIRNKRIVREDVVRIVEAVRKRKVSAVEAQAVLFAFESALK